MIYPIVVYGDPVLKKRAREISQDELDLKKLEQDLFETMEAAGGIGLAAPQVGLDIRVFIVDGSPLADEEEGMEDFKKIFINPQVLEEKGEPWAMEEGCLSIPGIREDVSRKESVTIRYRTMDWEEKTETYEGLQARIIQHEYDHIEGILFTDHLSNLKKRLLRNKLIKISRGDVKADYRLAIPARR